jgi:hypothetical protein
MPGVMAASTRRDAALACFRGLMSVGMDTESFPCGAQQENDDPGDREEPNQAAFVHGDFIRGVTMRSLVP